MTECLKCQYPNPGGQKTCFQCGEPLVVEPATVTVVASRNNPSQLATSSAAFIIDLNNLRPLERFLWDMSATKVTETQMLALINQESICVHDHPAFAMIVNDPMQRRLLICGHSTHDTEEKQQACRYKQAVKMTLQTVRHYLGFLERHELWSRPGQGGGYVMRTCIEKGGHIACAACKAREGLIEPVGQKRVEVMHINCHCSLALVQPGLIGDRVVTKNLEYLASIDPARAKIAMENVIRSGWRYTPSGLVGPGTVVASGCCGGVLAGMLASFVLVAAVAATMR